MAGLGLHHLTALDVPPFALAEIAATLGCTEICIFTNMPPGAAAFPFLAPEQAAEMEAKLAETGVRISNIEYFPIADEVPFDIYRAALDLGARLGAKRAVVHIHDIERARALENFGRMCGLASEYGLGVGLEFMAFAPACNSLEKALGFITDCGAPNAGIAVDALHLTRTGGTPAAVAAIDPSLFSYAQLCDGPPEMPPDRQLAEAIEARMIPGEGSFPLVELIQALPPDLPLDVEVPLKPLADQGIGALERARLAVAGARRVLEAAGRPR